MWSLSDGMEDSDYGRGQERLQGIGIRIVYTLSVKDIV